MRSPFKAGRLLVVFAIALTAVAQNTPRYHTGKLLQMESVQCVLELQTGGSHASNLCQEYVLEGEDALFHLHVLKANESSLLPVGKAVQYRISEGHFYLRLGNRDREYQVVAMEPRESQQPPVHSAEKINHLQ